MFTATKRDYATVFYSVRKDLKRFCIVLIIHRALLTHSAISKARITAVIRMPFLIFHLSLL